MEWGALRAHSHWKDQRCLPWSGWRRHRFWHNFAQPQPINPMSTQGRRSFSRPWNSWSTSTQILAQGRRIRHHHWTRRNGICATAQRAGWPCSLRQGIHQLWYLKRKCVSKNVISYFQVKPPPHSVFPAEEASDVINKLCKSEIPGRAILQFHSSAQ